MAAVTRSAVVPIGQVLLRDDGVLREGNARAAALLGAESAQSLAGATLASLIGPRAAVTVHAHVCAGETDACEVVARRRDGSAVALGFTAISRGSDGASVHLSEPTAPGDSYAGVVSAALADAAHGLRTSLAAARTSMDILQRGIAAPEDLPALHRVTRNSLARMDAMLSGLQEIARSHGGAPTAAELPALLQGAVMRARPHAAARGVTLTHRAPAAPTLALRADVAALSAALEALLHNAIEASAEGDEVELHTAWHPAARELHVVVTDRGEGIASERAPNVFRTFYSTRQAAGVGLTLARCVAAALGGDVALCCPPEGGTVATLRLSAAAFAAR